ANFDLTPEVATALARGVALSLLPRRVYIGGDTRESGPMLEAALVAGFVSSGVDVLLLGVVPTPAVAAAVAAGDDGTVGIMISASHNPYHDNGIKVFGPGGRKLTDADEADIEQAYMAFLQRKPAEPTPALPDGPIRPGSAISLSSPVDHLSLLHRASDSDLSGLSVVLDCANGAAAPWARQVFEHVCGSVHVIGDAPDGININDGVGSTYPGPLAEAVLAHGADVGLAFDGDADRVIAVDDTGNVVDGDHILAILAVDRRDRGALADDTVVVTQMSNLGFLRAMDEAGIDVKVTAVGDRYVLEAMATGGYTLGGEQSGHVICADLATTGDGMLAGLQLLSAMARAARPLSKMAGDAMVQYPQVLKNLRLERPDPGLVVKLADNIKAAEEAMGDRGRVLVRMSGTEPLLRVMVEHSEAGVAHTTADKLIAAALSFTGGGPGGTE
ncbi:MAG: phosphoglucosamine mutase, partial [Acidimicrobiales bacterium]|nr:phosphoglucosamine mutase [Acidimicrobiales bacterium]